LSPEYWADKEEQTNELIKGVSNEITSFESVVAKKYIELITDKLTTKGKIIIDSGTYSDIEKINSEVYDLMIKSDIPKRLKGIIDIIENEIELSSEFVEVVSGAKAKAVNISNEKKLFIKNMSDQIIGYESFKIKLISKYNDVLFNGIMQNASIGELRDSILNLSKKTVSKGSSLSIYAGQIATDTVNQYRGFVQSKIAENGRFDAWGYFGSLVEKSRPQCIRWVTDFNGVMPFSKLKEEVKWANKNGTGYGDIVLTEKNFPTIRGGHNCRHNVIAIVQNDKAEKYLNSLRRVINSRASQT